MELKVKINKKALLASVLALVLSACGGDSKSSDKATKSNAAPELNAAENTQHNKKNVLVKLKIFKNIYDYSVTSGELFEESINKIKKKLDKNILNCYLISHIPKNNLRKLGIRFKNELDSIDFILACSIKPNSDTQKFYNLLRTFVKKKKLMICINPDKKVFDGKVNKLVWQVGKLAEYYEKIGGKVIYFGTFLQLIFI